MDIIFTSVLIGIGLAMDCLAVSFAVGLIRRYPVYGRPSFWHCSLVVFRVA